MGQGLWPFTLNNGVLFVHHLSFIGKLAIFERSFKMESECMECPLGTKKCGIVEK